MQYHHRQVLVPEWLATGNPRQANATLRARILDERRYIRVRKIEPSPIAVLYQYGAREISRPHIPPTTSTAPDGHRIQQGRSHHDSV
jgi:hypothetical protein